MRAIVALLGRADTPSDPAAGFARNRQRGYFICRGCADHSPRGDKAAVLRRTRQRSDRDVDAKCGLPPITLTPVKRTSLRHIPGDEGWPVIGRTLAILADPKGEVERMAAKYGLVYRSRVLGETSISVLGPEANELLLFDQSKLFSSTHGWGTILGRLFRAD